MNNYNRVFSKAYTLIDKKQMKVLRGVVLLLVIGMVIESFSLAIIFPMIKLMTQPSSVIANPRYTFIYKYLNNYNESEILIISLLFLIIVYLAKTIFMLFSSWVQSKFAYSFQYSISNKLYRKYLFQDYKKFTELNSSKLISTVIVETNAFTQAFLLPVLFIISEIFILFGILCLIFFVNPIGAIIITLILFLTGFLFSKITKSKIIFWGMERQKYEAFRIQNIQEGLGGIKEIKVLGCEEAFISKYELSNLNSANLGMKISFLQNVPKQIIELVSIISICLIIFLNSFILNAGQELLPVLALFVASAFRMMPSVNRIMSSLQNIRFSSTVVDLLYNELLDYKDDSFIKSENHKFMFDSEINIKNLSFSYDNNILIFDSLNVTIQKGETIGIVGGSGCGKTTLIDIILGILLPPSGDLTVDGVSIYSNLKLWQNNIGYVPQNIYLTDDSIKNNIALGIPEDEIDIEKLNKAVSEAQLDTFLKSIKYGYNSVVGENGVRLSGGQKQRIGIARALYHKPDVLIFDEATSALDGKTEIDVMRSINSLKSGRTIVIIAHRLSTLEQCDKIYEIKDKKLILKSSLK